MPRPPDIIYSYQECTKANLAPQANEAEWKCISQLIEYIHGLKRDFIAGKFKGDKTRIVFRSAATSDNLITIWPKSKLDGIDIDARAASPESLNRINKRMFSTADFDASFKTIGAAIYEVLTK